MLRAVRVSIELAHESADPEVALHYVLRVPAGTRSIAVRLVEFFGAEPREISATAAGRALALDARRVGPLWEGELFLPESAQSDTAMRLDIQYSVANARRGRGDRFDFAIPLFLVTWNPETSADTFFTAEIRLPEEAHLSEIFPTVPLAIAFTPGVRSHTLTLPVVPSLVRFRGGVGAPPLLGFTGLVDVGVGLLLGTLALIGWRRLRAGD